MLLGAGGFGKTYQVTRQKQDGVKVKVAIKEEIVSIR